MRVVYIVFLILTEFTVLCCVSSIYSTYCVDMFPRFSVCVLTMLSGVYCAYIVYLLLNIGANTLRSILILSVKFC